MRTTAISSKVDPSDAVGGGTMTVTALEPSLPIGDVRPAGLSLRDYFAAAALTGAMSHLGPGLHEVPNVARLVYRVADRVLAERGKKPA